MPDVREVERKRACCTATMLVQANQAQKSSEFVPHDLAETVCDVYRAHIKIYRKKLQGDIFILAQIPTVS